MHYVRAGEKNHLCCCMDGWRAVGGFPAINVVGNRGRAFYKCLLAFNSTKINTLYD
jgi:hypothetical protein